MTNGQAILHALIVYAGPVLVLVGGYFAATAPVGRWRYRRKARAVLRHLIRHHERMERAA